MKQPAELQVNDCTYIQKSKYEKVLQFVRKCQDAPGAYQPQEDAEELLREIGEMDE